MDDPNDPITPGRIRTLTIIVFAQTMGLVVFAAVAVYLVHQQGVPIRHTDFLSPLGLIMLAVMGPASIAFPLFIRRQNVGRIARGEWKPPPGAASAYTSDAAKLFAVYLTSTIVGLALVEGAGILCCLAYLLEGQTYVLALIAIAVVLQIARFPTEGRLRAWMGRQLDWMEQERQRTGAE